MLLEKPILWQIPSPNTVIRLPVPTCTSTSKELPKSTKNLSSARPHRPPDEDQSERLNVADKTHTGTLSDSSHNSTNSQSTDAINTIISVKELEATRKIISPSVSILIREKVIGYMESPSFDLNHSKNSTDFTVLIDGNREAICAKDVNESLELRHQFRDTSSQPRADSITGDYSPHDGVHLTEISSKMDGGITGGEESGELRAKVAGVYEQTGKGNISPQMETHPSDISNNLEEGTTNNNQSIPPDKAVAVDILVIATIKANACSNRSTNSRTSNSYIHRNCHYRWNRLALVGRLILDPP
ncbi:hypothetical protein H5410_045706 [Solanum commersonii]|uniref:Uncharacterized protein n=1 Tax=Solanum commersonii TaxID=4109 RepID=A0A9J5XEF8_SOLCO|nr:hypothetical protein H5410_045706 [Solanum commersonii]